MAIRRTTVSEHDDSPDRVSQTSAPDGFSQAQTRAPIAPRQTEIPGDDDGVAALETDADVFTPAPVKGRTFPDLIVEAVENPRLMATALFFLPVPFFVGKIDAISDLTIPLIVGGFLNTVWFTIGFFRWAINRKQS